MLKKILKICTTLFVILLVLAIAGCIWIGLIIGKAPELNTEDAVPDGYLSTVFDTEGNTMLTLAGAEANRIYVDLSLIPEDVQNAFVAIEDERFFTHHGIDLRGIVRAAYKGVTTGNFSEGASTITQQLLKNNILTTWTQEKTFYDKVQRKIQEQYLAICLEQQESKEWILENYLNTINLGSGSWGVQAASRRYFNKNVSELSLSEAAVIAGITKSPAAYDPIKHPDRNADRRELVLKKMVELEMISQETCDAALADDVYTRIADVHTENKAQIFSYFEDVMLQQIVDDLRERYHYTEEEAWDKIYRGGLTIYATQDTALQRRCEQALNDPSLYDGSAQMTAVMTDVKTGAVKALVGGRGEKTASLVYNRAVSGIRQPGSTIKVIGEYAAALDDGTITLATSLDDEPYSYSNGTEIHNASGGYNGMTTIRDSIVRSLNVPALKVFQEETLDAVWDQLKDFGITTLKEEDRVEALAIGGTFGGVTNLEMTAAYNAIAADGEYVKPYFYTKVLDHDQNVLLEVTPEKTQAIRKPAARLLTAAMEGVLTEGTGRKALFEGIPLAGKSGTSSDYKDVWFIGYTPNVTLGIWGGNDSGDAQDNGDYVKVIWKDIMQEAAQLYPASAFGFEESMEAARICTKCGNLAVEGLCDESLQGDVTEVLYFEDGTVPTEKCSCHKSVTICQESKKKAGIYCPEEKKTTKIYLLSGTEGTADEKYVLPKGVEDPCDEHTSFWSQWWNSGKDETTEQTPPAGPQEQPGTDQGNDDERPWWDIFGTTQTPEPEPEPEPEPQPDPGQQRESRDLWDWFTSLF